MSNWRNRRLSSADEALVADVEKRLADSSPPSPAQRPDGQTVDEKVYVAAGVAMAAVDPDDDEPELYEWHQCSDQPGCSFPRGCPCAGKPYPSAVVRAAVDSAFAAGRSALLADLDAAQREVETMTYVAQRNKRHVADLTEYVTQVEAERDRMWPVVEAARALAAFRKRDKNDESIPAAEHLRLINAHSAAVDTYETQAGGTDGD